MVKFQDAIIYSFSKKLVKITENDCSIKIMHLAINPHWYYQKHQ